MDLQEMLTYLLTSSSNYSSLTVDNILLALGTAFVLNMLIFFLYRKTYRGVAYNRNFNVGLVLIGLIVTLVVLPIRSNLSLALGMVGALSIVRFRTTIKDPKDVIFTFWSIAVGITCGSGFYVIAVIGVPLIGFILYALEQTNLRGPDSYLLVVHYAGDAESAVQAALPKYKLRSRTAASGGVELMGEVTMNAGDASLADRLLKIPGVKDVSVMSFVSDS